MKESILLWHFSRPKFMLGAVIVSTWPREKKKKKPSYNTPYTEFKFDYNTPYTELKFEGSKVRYMQSVNAWYLFLYVYSSSFGENELTF